VHICLDNFIDAEGGCALAESLKQNMTLTQLNLNGKCVAVFNAGDEIQLTCAYFQRIILVTRVAVLWLSL
jgi:hypothetical protein